mgnify:CR=1 FL=1
MAYMPLDKVKMYLDDSKMVKIYDLSQPWGVDTPLWPFPGARTDLQFPRGQYLGRFHKNHDLHRHPACRYPYGCSQPCAP